MMRDDVRGITFGPLFFFSFSFCSPFDLPFGGWGSLVEGGAFLSDISFNSTQSLDSADMDLYRRAEFTTLLCIENLDFNHTSDKDLESPPDSGSKDVLV